MRLEGSERTPFPGPHQVAPLEQDDRVDVTILLRRRDAALRYPDVARLARRAPSERGYLTRETFVQYHGADPKDIDRVSAFARSQGLEVGRPSIGARTVRVAGPAGVVGPLFGASLERWSFPGGSFRGRTGYLSLPKELEGIAVGVFGLDNRPQARTHFVRHKTFAASDVAYTPPTVAAAYDFPTGTDGSGETIGLLELGGGFSASDLTSYFGQLGVPAPNVTVVSVDGAGNAPTGNPDGPDGEVELDIEVAGSVAPGARVVVYFAPNTDRGFLDGLNEALHDTANRPSVVSISWGSPESSWTAQARAALNGACEDAATMGVSVLVAAGDNGASDGVSSGALNVDFPASSPFATACGGTRLLLKGGKIESEVVWNELAIGEGATGGGVSTAFPLPSFQLSANVPKAQNGFVGRGVPDVAGDADPASGYSVRVDGTDTVIGGTSAVAPLWAALLARINQSLGVPAGYVNPLLYSSVGAATFHDVTSGNNDGFSAGPGWDPCTGWGTPDGSRLLQVLRSASTAP
ncbi:MAG TPA: S53 family peptidase [Thermoplasmata archaeon]|nr:S53 family peptidase [Thermoplasmata archaeon]